MQIKRKLLISALSVLLCLCCIFGVTILLSNINSIAKAETMVDVNEREQGYHLDDSCSMDGDCISFESDKVAFVLGEDITAHFKVYSESSILSYNYVQDGYSQVSITQVENSLYLELVSKTSYQCSYIAVTVLLSSKQCLVASLYAVNNEYGVFISPFSEDDAYENFYMYAKNNASRTLTYVIFCLKYNRKTPQIVLIYGVFLKNSLFVLFTWCTK